METPEKREYEGEPAAVSALINGAALLLSLIGNSSVVFIICRTPRLHTPSCLLMAALAIVNVLLALVWNVTPLALLNPTLREMLPGGTLCDIVGLSWQTMMSMSALLQGIIAFDRYFFIVHPLKYQIHITNKRAIGCCAIVFILALSIPTAILFAGNTYRFTPPAMICTGPTLWSILFLALIVLPSLTVTIFSYQRIWTLCSNALKQTLRGQESRGSFVRSANASARAAHVNNMAGRKAASVTCLQKIEPAKFCKQTIFNSESALKESNVAGASQPKISVEHPIVRVSRWSEVTANKTVSTVSKNERRSNTYITTIAGTVPEKLPLEHTTDKENNIFASYSFDTPVSVIKVEKTENYVEKISTRRTTRTETTCVVTVHSDEASLKPDVLPGTSVSSSSTDNLMSKSVTPKLSLKSSPFAAGKKTSNPNSLTEALDNIYIAARSRSVATCTTPRLTVNDKTKKKINTLQQTAILNPVISWMLHQEQTLSPVLGSMMSIGKVSQLKVNPGLLSLSCSRSRRLKAIQLVGLPVFGIVMSSLPLLVSLLVWDNGHKTHADFLGVRIVSILSYAIVPSAMLLLLCLTNKPYRRVLKGYLCCSLNKIQHQF